MPQVRISASSSGALAQSCPRLEGCWGSERQPRSLARSRQALSPASDREQLSVSKERIPEEGQCVMIVTGSICQLPAARGLPESLPEPVRSSGAPECLGFRTLPCNEPHC